MIDQDLMDKYINPYLEKHIDFEEYPNHGIILNLKTNLYITDIVKFINNAYGVNGELAIGKYCYNREFKNFSFFVTRESWRFMRTISFPQLWLYIEGGKIIE